MLKNLFKPKVLLWIAGVLVVLLVVAYIGIGIYGANTFNKNAKRATPYEANTPASYGLTYEDVSFQTAGEPALTLRGWWIPNSGSDQALVVVHGRDADRTRHLSLSKPLWNNGFNLLYFDLQGQGTSDGDRYYFGQREQYDVIGAFNFVKSKGFNPDKIGVLSFSMGGSSTLLALSQDPEIKTVVSDSAYADFDKVAQYRIVQDNGLPAFLLPGIYTVGRIWYGFDIDQAKPVNTLPAVTGRHIFLIHGTEDKDILPEHFYMLQKAGGSNIAETWVAQGAKHVSTYEVYPEEYMQRVTTFFKQNLAGTSQEVLAYSQS